MLDLHLHNTLEKYTEKYHHWCPQSEAYAGGDQLISALREGWDLVDHIVRVKQEWKRGTRPVNIYHFVLERDDDRMVMPTLHNPFVARFIMDQALTLTYDEINASNEML